MRISIISGVALLASTVSAHAQATFAEFTVGAGFPSNVDTVRYSVISPVGFVTTNGTTVNVGDDLTGSLSGSYNAGITGGVEIGMRGVGDKHLALSVSYDYLQANLESITATGTINGVASSATESLEALGLTGADFNNEAHLILGNLRYDFVGPREQFQPFVSIGGGTAIIEDSNAAAAFGATAGVKVPLGLGFYAGARYRYVRVFGYEDQLGIEYKNLNAHLLSFMLGAQL